MDSQFFDNFKGLVNVIEPNITEEQYNKMIDLLNKENQKFKEFVKQYSILLTGKNELMYENEKLQENPNFKMEQELKRLQDKYDKLLKEYQNLRQQKEAVWNFLKPNNLEPKYN